MRRRTVIITGANSGIGKAAAVKFASEGFRVIMACRDLARSQRAQQEVIQASKSHSVELSALDVSSFDSVRSFCAGFRSAHPKLDVLIHNAGYFEHGIKTYQLSPDGLELTFATNVFGPLLMTELLRDRLAESDDPRVLHAGTTNIKHFFDPKREIEFDNLQSEYKDTRPYSVYKMYGDSKMALLLLTYKMAEVYRHQGITVNYLMIPATRVSRETLRKFSLYYRALALISMNLNPFARPPRDIADSYYHICTADELRDATGVVFNARNERILPAETDKPLSGASLLRELLNTRHTPAYADDPANIERMWTLSMQVIAAALGQ